MQGHGFFKWGENSTGSLRTPACPGSKYYIGAFCFARRRAAYLFPFHSSSWQMLSWRDPRKIWQIPVISYHHTPVLMSPSTPRPVPRGGAALTQILFWTPALVAKLVQRHQQHMEQGVGHCTQLKKQTIAHQCGSKSNHRHLILSKSLSVTDFKVTNDTTLQASKCRHLERKEKVHPNNGQKNLMHENIQDHFCKLYLANYCSSFQNTNRHPNTNFQLPQSTQFMSNLDIRIHTKLITSISAAWSLSPNARLKLRCGHSPKS